MSVHFAPAAWPLAAVNPPELSIVIPVYNEQDGLAGLFARLYPALDALGASYEIVFVNDGSRDGSVSLLAVVTIEQHHPRDIGAAPELFGQ